MRLWLATWIDRWVAGPFPSHSITGSVRGVPGYPQNVRSRLHSWPSTGVGSVCSDNDAALTPPPASVDLRRFCNQENLPTRDKAWNRLTGGGQGGRWIGLRLGLRNPVLCFIRFFAQAVLPPLQHHTETTTEYVQAHHSTGPVPSPDQPFSPFAHCTHHTTRKSIQLTVRNRSLRSFFHLLPSKK